jgi:type II secretory pathway pseudopilin PulG
MATSTKPSSRGFALIDTIVGVAIAALLSLALIGSIYHAQSATAVARDRMQVNAITLGTYEALVGLATANYSTFTSALGSNNCSSAPCHVSAETGSWRVVSGTKTINSAYDIAFTASPVRRDSTGSIVEVGGTIDADTTALSITVTWTTRRGTNRSETTTTYVHRIEL